MKMIRFLLLVLTLLILSGCSDDNGTAPVATASSSGGGGSGVGSGSETEEETTPVSAVYIYQSDSTYQAYDLKVQASNFQTICSNSFASYSSSVSCTNFYPFLGKSSTNGFKTYISANSLNENSPVKLINGSTVVASTLLNLINNGPALKGSDTWVGWSDNYWYSGVAADGSAGENCSDYSSDISSQKVSMGRNGTSFSWVDRSQFCDYYDDYKILCLCN